MICLLFGSSKTKSNTMRIFERNNWRSLSQDAIHIYYDIVLTVSVDGTDTIYYLGYRAFQISRTRNPNAITRCLLRRSSVILALLYYKKYIVELELKMTSNLDRHGRICPSTISCTLLLIRTKTSQKSQENAGCSSPSLWTLLMKLWVDLEHMPAISRNNIF